MGSVASQRDRQVLWCIADCILDEDLRISLPTEHVWICFLTSCHRAVPPTQRARICLLESSHTDNYEASLAEFNKPFTDHLFFKMPFFFKVIEQASAELRNQALRGNTTVRKEWLEIGNKTTEQDCKVSRRGAKPESGQVSP